MVENTTSNAASEESTGESRAHNVDQIHSIKTQGLLRSSSKDDSGDDKVLDQNRKLKRRIEGGIVSSDVKKVRLETGEVISDLVESVFEWPAYLRETNSKEVPKMFFKHIVPECMCGFESGMKLEVLNKDYKNTYWLATIVAKASPLILVRYEGFKENNKADFWCNTLTDDIHPVGWCARTKHALKPPKAIQHKEKNWYAYLIKNLTGARKASENLFLKKSHPVHYLRAGHYVEVIDQYNPTCYWLARIIEVFSGRLNLQYEGFEDPTNDSWYYYLNENLRPVGYGLKQSLTLYPPRSSQAISHAQFGRITEKLINLSKRNDNTVFKTLFQERSTKRPHNLRLGMKLEAVHPNDATKICAASVTRVFDAVYFLVKVDNLISMQEDVTDSFVAHRDSANIFPVGFCVHNGLPLQQPKGYIGRFTWENYLRYTKTEPIPTTFFPERISSCGIEVGMKLEAVDREQPVNICVTTVKRVMNGHLWLHIDGDTRDEQIFPFESYEIFPVGWCEKTGHELQWPRPDTLEQKNRISSLRHTATRQNRLEVLRKGKLRNGTNEGKENSNNKKDLTPSYKHKRKQTAVYKQRRGVSRKRIVNDDSNEGTVDTTIAFVCINRLAREFNTEDSIKQFYRLDSEGKLPAEVVTIDDDDDDNKDDDGKKSKHDKGNFTESDLSFFSFLKVKPKTLTKSESEMYETKLTENDGNTGGDMAISGLSPPASGNRKLRSLNSVVAMLTANKSTNNRAHLMDTAQFKQNKAAKNKLLASKTAANAEHSQKESGNSLEKAQIIDLCNEDSNTVKSPSSHVNDAINMLSSPDGSINIPGKGQYRIMEQIVTKHGDKNKIILRLGKPPVVNKPTNGSIYIPPAAPTQSAKITSSTETAQVTTHVEDMYTLSNMARSHTGLDEVLRNRFNKVRSFCTVLPKNPLLWSPGHVATFVTNADFEKYAKNFHDQEIDGHSLLLLTVQEIHHILGLPLGPAMKIHDFIFTLQQLVNEAYLSKHTPTVAATSSTATNKIPKYHDKNDTREERSTSLHGANEIYLEKDVLPKSFTSKSTAVQKEGLSNDPITAAVELSREKVAKWIDNNNDTLEKIRIETAFEFKTGETSLGPSYLTKQIASAAKYGITSEVFSSSESITAPSQSFQTPRNYYPHPVRILPFHPGAMPQQPGPRADVMYPPQMQFIPIRPQMITDNGSDPQVDAAPESPYIIQFPYSGNSPDNIEDASGNTTENNETGQKCEISVSIKQENVEKPHQKRPSNSADEVPDKIPKLEDPVDSTPSPEPTVVASFTSLTQETYDNHLSGVSISLVNSQLWEKFYKSGTEMILTRTGRRMFPSFQVNISGLSDYQKYVIILDFVPVDHYRYKFEFETSRWMFACDEGTPPPTRIYVHPKYPAYGSNWMSSVVDFTRCKLTNNSVEASGNILLHSMHKYQPRIHVIFWDNKQAMRNPYDLLKYGCKKIFTFEETKFIAVTAYQNTQVTQLKIDSNPFARGFRGDWRKEKEKNARKKNGEDDGGEHSDYTEELDVPHHEKSMAEEASSFT